MEHQTKKLKLVCSFNGGFRRHFPGEKLRYTGGETRLVSVDPTSLTFSSLCFIISQPFQLTNSDFKLKYLLPGSGDPALILLASDDDVLCMLEEYQKVTLFGKNFSRLWVFVFNGNCNDPFKDLCKSGDFDCGFRVLGENLVGCEKGFSGFKNLLGDTKSGNNYNHDHKNGRRKVGSNDNHDRLRKLVLKRQISQQLMNARQREESGRIIDCSLGDNLGRFDTPLMDLGLNTWNSGSGKNSVNDGNSGSFCRKFGCVGKLMNIGPLSCGGSNLFEEKNRNLGSVMGDGCEELNGCSNNERKLNRENFLPSFLNSYALCDWNSMEFQFDGKHMVPVSRCIRSCQFHSSQNGSGKMLVGAKCYPGLGVSKQGQAMKFHHSNSSSRSLKGANGSQAIEMKKRIDFDKEITRKQGSEGSVKQSEVFQCTDLDSVETLDLRKESLRVKYPDIYDYCSGTTIMCEPNHDKANVNGLIGSHPTPNGIASSKDLSSSNPTMSINGIITKWEKGCSMQEEMQGDPPVTPSIVNKVDSFPKIANMNDGIPSDLASFHTHLSARGLQTIPDADLEYVKELGSGNYGTVYHGKWKGSDVAIKKIKLSCFNGDAKQEDRLVADFWKEAHMLSQLHHPNIVAFYGVVTDGPIETLATVNEYMINGSLKQVLQRKDRTIDRRKRLIIAMDAAFGMEYLHEKNIVHFDLKSHNFLVNMRDPQRPVCKIGDLGLSKIKQKTMISGGVRGTIPWMAPELLNNDTNLVTEKVDVYSFGVVMWELLTGEEPYAGMRSGNIIAGKIKGTLHPEIPSWCDPIWRSLMERCWSTDPKSRPSFSEIAKELRVISAEMNIK